jgi:hypothetical protein
MYEKKPPPVAAKEPEWFGIPTTGEDPGDCCKPDLETGVSHREPFKDNSFKESRNVRYSTAHKDA